MRKRARLLFEGSDAAMAMVQSLTGLTQTLSLRSREAHWNVKGANFNPLHEFFGDFYDFSNDWVDTLAERIVQQGGVASALVGGWEPAPELGDAKTLLQDLSELSNRLAEQIHQTIKMLDEDESTKDILIEMNRELEKWIWKIEAHLQEVIKVAAKNKTASSDAPPLQTHTYTWLHQPTGKSGTKEWSGLSYEDFQNDLADWNRKGYGTWMYTEEGQEAEDGEDEALFSPTHRVAAQAPPPPAYVDLQADADVFEATNKLGAAVNAVYGVLDVSKEDADRDAVGDCVAFLMSHGRFQSSDHGTTRIVLTPMLKTQIQKLYKLKAGRTNF